MPEPQRYWEKIAEQAAEISRLTAENERLRAVLKATECNLIGTIGSDNIRIANALLTVQAALDTLCQQRTNMEK